MKYSKQIFFFFCSVKLHIKDGKVCWKSRDKLHSKIVLQMVILQSGIASHMYIKKNKYLHFFFLSLTQISFNCVRMTEWGKKKAHQIVSLEHWCFQLIKKFIEREHPSSRLQATISSTPDPPITADWKFDGLPKPIIVT